MAGRVAVDEELHVGIPDLLPATRRDVRITLLNGFGVTYHGQRVALATSAQRLLAFLALNDRPLPRVYVAGILWIDATEKHANGSLRSAIWRVRLGNLDVVDVSADHLSLNRWVAVDLREAEQQARRLLDPSCECFESDFDESPFCGELLPGWYYDWVLIERERQRQIRLHALEVLCERLTVKGQYGKAIRAGLAAISAEPLRESAHRILIRAHLAEGNPGEALRQYHLYEQLLHDELQLKPSARIKEIVGAL